MDLFYDKNMKDDRINAMFENADIDALKIHQFNFLRFAFSKQGGGARPILFVQSRSTRGLTD